MLIRIQILKYVISIEFSSIYSHHFNTNFRIYSLHFNLSFSIFQSFPPQIQSPIHKINSTQLKSTSSWHRHSSPLIYTTTDSCACEYIKICTTVVRPRITCFYRPFIKDFSKIFRLLYNLLVKDVPFVSDDSCIVAFEKLKQLLTSLLIIQPPN